MKKIVIILLGLSLVTLSLSSCKDKEKASDAETDTDSSIISENVDSAESDGQQESSSNDEAAGNQQGENDNTVKTPQQSGQGTNSGSVSGSSSSSSTSVSNEYFTVSSDKPLSDGGTVTVTVATKNISSIGKVYGVQLALSYSGLTLDSSSKASLPSGWSCSITDSKTANTNSRAILLLDCDFSSSLGDQDIATITFNSNGNGAQLTVNDISLIKGNNDTFTKVSASAVTL